MYILNLFQNAYTPVTIKLGEHADPFLGIGIGYNTVKIDGQHHDRCLRRISRVNGCEYLNNLFYFCFKHNVNSVMKGEYCMAGLSTRASGSVQPGSGFDFIKAHFECENNAYTADNPRGFVNMGSSQNLLFHDEIHKQLSTAELSIDDLKYLAFPGKPKFINTLCNFINRFYKTNIDTERLVIGNGVISLLEALTFCVIDPGDTVVVPTPVFPALLTAISKRMGGVAHELAVGEDDGFILTPTHVEHCLESLRATGKPAKALLLCSPGNPSGQVFSEEDLRALARITKQHDCHMIVDEIYAMDVFTGRDFFSALELCDTHVHVLGGFSKDFGMAGYACAWMHSNDRDVLTCVKGQSHFYRVSNQQQSLLTHLLSNLSFCENYLHNNRIALTKAYRDGVEYLKSSNVNVHSSQAGLSLWIDMRTYLPQQSYDAELDLYKYLLNEHRVHISPGQAFKCPTPGYYRLCFSLAESIRYEGLSRISNGLQSYS